MDPSQRGPRRRHSDHLILSVQVWRGSWGTFRRRHVPCPARDSRSAEAEAPPPRPRPRAAASRARRNAGEERGADVSGGAFSASAAAQTTASTTDPNGKGGMEPGAAGAPVSGAVRKTVPRLSSVSLAADASCWRGPRLADERGERACESVAAWRPTRVDPSARRCRFEIPSASPNCLRVPELHLRAGDEGADGLVGEDRR